MCAVRKYLLFNAPSLNSCYYRVICKRPQGARGMTDNCWFSFGLRANTATHSGVAVDMLRRRRRGHSKECEKMSQEQVFAEIFNYNLVSIHSHALL